MKAFPYRTTEQVLLDRTLGVEPVALSETKTDADGGFRLALPAAEVSLRIAAAGRPSVEMAGPFGSDDADEPIEISLADGRKLSGRVVDESGAAVAGASVRASAPLEFPEDSIAVAETKTSPDGAFTLAAAPKGDVALRIWAKGFAAASDRGAHPAPRVVLTRGGGIEGVLRDAKAGTVSGAIVASADAAARTDSDGKWRIEALREGLVSLSAASADGDRVARKDVVRVRKGAVVHVDLVLQPETGIAGMIVDAANKRPISHARVEALDDPYPMPSSTAAARARTDARGRFRLVGLARREYRVAAWRTGYLVSSVPVTAASPATGPVRIALARGGSISGRVVDEAGAGVAGVRVRMLPGEGRRGMLLNHPTRVAAPSAVTRSGGAFELAGLPPGLALSVIATRSGYVAARREGLTATTAKAKSVTLVLRRGLEARGRVVDEGGGPVAAAEITLSRVEERRMGGAVMSGDDPDAMRTARTGADGRFAVAALDGGKYEAAIKQPAYAPATMSGLTVRGPGVTEWNPFVLHPPAPIAGVVRSRKGDPIPGARINAFGEGGSDDTTTDAAGRFRLAGFAAGVSVSLQVEADGFAPAKQSVKAPAADVPIVLSTAATVRGRVEDAGTQQPVPDFSIGGRVQGVSYIESRAVRSEDGSFEMPDVAPGKLTIRVQAPGYLAGSLSAIELGEGEVKEGVVVSLKKGLGVSGRVLDPRGNAVANATVSWRRVSAWDSSGFVVGPTGMFAMVSNAATTDADGRFQYDAVPPEKLIFKASHPDFLDAEKTVDASSETAVEVTLSDGSSISGRVTADDGGASAASAEVALSTTGAAPNALSSDETRADESGAFRFEHLKPGRFKVTAKAASGRSGTADVVLAEGQSRDGVLVELSGGATIRGVVTGLPPERLSGLEVDAYQGRSYSAAVDTEADGTFTIEGVPAGALQLTASQKRWAPGSRAVTKSVEVPEGAGEIPVELAFAGGSHLEVRITRRDQPLSGQFVQVSPDPYGSPGAQVYGQTDGDGRVAFDGIPDGAYIVDARSYDAQGGRATRKIAVAGDTSIEITLGGGALSGTVTDAATGEPLSDAGVTAETGQETSNWSVPRAQTDSQGRYSIDSLDAGDVQVTARRDGYRQKTLAATIADSPAELSFTLSKGGGLAVHAKDGLTGMPLSGLWALAFSDSGATAFSGPVALDGQGNGEVASLAPGTYTLHLFSSGYAPGAITSASVPSASPLEVALTPGGRIEVEAASASAGRLVDSAGVTYLPGVGKLDGRLAISPPRTLWEHVTPGSYRLIVEGSDGNTEYSVTVREGETTRVELKPL